MVGGHKDRHTHTSTDTQTLQSTLFKNPGGYTKIMTGIRKILYLLKGTLESYGHIFCLVWITGIGPNFKSYIFTMSSELYHYIINCLYFRLPSLFLHSLKQCSSNHLTHQLLNLGRNLEKYETCQAPCLLLKGL